MRTCDLEFFVVEYFEVVVALLVAAGIRHEGLLHDVESESGFESGVVELGPEVVRCLLINEPEFWVIFDEFL